MRDYHYYDAPSDAVWVDAQTPNRCWNCEFYSFKVYGDDDDTSGKCFRDRGAGGRTYYVDGLMSCPGFKPETVEDDH